jgi:ABC-type nitrate/sulfonate/bicarbonate transport system substrate-binding protein
MKPAVARISRRYTLKGASALVAASVAAPHLVRAQAKRELRIADTNAIHEMPVYAFPEFIDPQYTIKQFNLGSAGTSILAAMINGMCDVMSTANSYLVTARAEGAKLIPVCGVAGKGQAIVARQDRIKTLEDLKGKKLVTKKLTSSHVMLQITLKSVGIDPLKDVEILDIGQPAGFTLMLERGEAEAGQLWEPFVSIAASKPGLQKLELKRFFDLTWRTHSALFVTQKMIDEEPQVIKDLIAANIKTIAAVRADRAKYLSIVTKRAGHPPEVLNAAIDNCDPRVEMDATMFYRMAEEMFALGIVRTDVAGDIENSINYKLLSEVTGRSPHELGYVSYADYKAGKRPVIQ